MTSRARSAPAPLTVEDVRAAMDPFTSADTVCLQRQQLPGAVVAATELVHRHDARVVVLGGGGLGMP